MKRQERTNISASSDVIKKTEEHLVCNVISH